MITFANPAWLYGLLGLLIPIGIHLLSRKEGKTIYIGSIRHLTDSDTAQFSSIRLNELVLLMLRLLLLALLVFLLAGFNIVFRKNEIRQWLVIEKGVGHNQPYKSLIDSLKTKGFEIHWLAENLPKFEDSGHVVPPSNYYKLITQIQAQADTVIVLSYSYANLFRGEMASMPPSINWMTVDPAEKQLAVKAVKLAGDSLLMRIANSNAKGTSFEYERLTINDFEKFAKIVSLQVMPADTIDIAIFAAPEFDYDKKIIQAAIQAIANGLPEKFNISTLNKSTDISESADFVFWLSLEPCHLKEPSIIGYLNCSNSNLPLLLSGEKSVRYCDAAKSFEWILSKRLNEENALEENLSFSLAKILLNDMAIYHNTNITTVDQRSFPTEAAFAEQSRNYDAVGGVKNSPGSEPPLFMFMFLVLIAERVIAYKRNQ